MADDHHNLEKPSTISDPVVAASTAAAAAAAGGVAGAESAKHQESNKELEFTEDEETLIIRMYNLVGERWSLISGRIPGRSAGEIEKYWKSKHATSK